MTRSDLLKPRRIHAEDEGKRERFIAAAPANGLEQRTPPVFDLFS